MYIEFHTGLRDEIKIHRLARELQIEYPTALGHVSCLWLWTAQSAPDDGNLSSFDAEEIAHGALWNGENFDEFLVALKKVGLIDEKTCINNWPKYGVRLLLQRREASTAYRKRHKRDMTKTSKAYPTMKERKKERSSLFLKGVVKGETPHQVIINRFLELKGTPREKLTKDQVSGAYKRHSRSALALIREAGGLEYATAALEWGAGYFDRKNLTWTIDTIAKHLPTLASCGRDEEAARKYGLNPGEIRYAQRLSEWLSREQEGGGGMSTGASQSNSVDGNRP